MNVLTVYYTMYGHTLQMANSVHEGVNSVDGVRGVLRRVAEFEVVDKIIDNNDFARRIREQQKDVPVCTIDDLKNADGVVFGTPTRYGNMTAQMKQLIDATVELWMNGDMEGKPAGVFTSTASTHGGQETTPLTMMAPLLHLGMIVVGVPYSTPGMIHTEARGGTPYGASTIAGPEGELNPTEEDLKIAMALGHRVADVARRLRG
jgi:NAD(P)H dehydrogenase (quinone)